MAQREVSSKTWYLNKQLNAQELGSQADLTFEVADKTDLKTYLTIYERVGKQWLWVNRILLDEGELRKTLVNPKVYIYYIIIDSDIIGLIELEETNEYEMEVVYFGLLETTIGKGYGKMAFKFVEQKAMEKGKKTLWLHTCEFDHPNALSFYKKMGMKLYKEEILTQVLPG